MKMSEINELTLEQKQEKILENKKLLLNLRFQLATGNLENTTQIKTLKKDIARLKTSLNQK
ncbi:MAG: 50S ribosomal protein L29 [Mycoplasmatales bacterium]